VIESIKGMLAPNSGSNTFISTSSLLGGRVTAGFEGYSASCQSAGHMWIANGLISPEANDLSPKRRQKVNTPK